MAGWVRAGGARASREEARVAGEGKGREESAHAHAAQKSKGCTQKNNGLGSPITRPPQPKPSLGSFGNLWAVARARTLLPRRKRTRRWCVSVPHPLGRSQRQAAMASRSKAGKFDFSDPCFHEQYHTKEKGKQLKKE